MSIERSAVITTPARTTLIEVSTPLDDDHHWSLRVTAGSIGVRTYTFPEGKEAAVNKFAELVTESLAEQEWKEQI